MRAASLQAHYDGDKVVFDEPVDLPSEARLLVTVMPTPEQRALNEEKAWLGVAASSDALAFLAADVEDIYTPEDGEPFRDAL